MRVAEFWESSVRKSAVFCESYLIPGSFVLAHFPDVSFLFHLSLPPLCSAASISILSGGLFCGMGLCVSDFGIGSVGMSIMVLPLLRVPAHLLILLLSALKGGFVFETAHDEQYSMMLPDESS